VAKIRVVLPDTDHDQALVVARKLRECVGLQPFVVGKQRISVTASFGLCSVGAVGIKRTSIAQRILIAADKAMYHSKEKGRDRITTVRFS
jgi:diguanylate cyclase (GGDEF)-like protein